ncbi:histidine phosphatase family protein [Kineococcus indalonis]|uniref:histidine phosphatase family protein n=1 Tax=Kineococcus indalonis TaxID=2696566 RepID=UPI0014133998|nr:histidine phosphatase family protein [Kineococcus indalonis]NAZ86852.1 histidine phosphatase family protein [Kineococcus indalonis]
MRLLLVRHGQTPSNVRRLLDTGVPGPGLTDLGREQAEALADTLAGEGVGAVTASSQVRAQLTAAPLAARLGLDVAVDAGLREIEAGEVEMRGDDEAVVRYFGVVTAWLGGDLAAALPGAPDGHAFFARYDAAVAAAAERARAAGVGTFALVSHGAAIRAWAGARAVNLSARFVLDTGLLNTGVVDLRGDVDGGWTCESWTGAALEAVQAEAAGAGAAGEPGSVF